MSSDASNNPASAADKRSRIRARARTPMLPLRDQVHFPGIITTVQVARDRSRAAVELALKGDQLVVVVSQNDMALTDLRLEDLHSVGTLSEILHAVPLPTGALRVTLRGLRRVAAERPAEKGDAYVADPVELAVFESASPSLECTALVRATIESFHQLVSLHKQIPAEALDQVSEHDTPGQVADHILHFLPISPAEKQNGLEELDVMRRLQSVFELVKREEALLAAEREVTQKVDSEIADSQRLYYLHAQLRTIQEEIALRENRPSEADQIQARIQATALSDLARKAAERELDRLRQAPNGTPESFVSRTYLDALLQLPWGELTEDSTDFDLARRELEHAHFGLVTVKERILEFLAVRKLRRETSGAMLCFVGPPGVGKTSFARALAIALDRRYAHIAVGGVRDEAEIRGHRRTYVAAMPGRIAKALTEAGSMNPVLVLDELDKVGQSVQGDPTGALLEALDPEQNQRFVDHYLETPLDLSKVIFVATANNLDLIPVALRDRMEIVEFPGYTDSERRRICQDYVFPKCLRKAGLSTKIKLEREAATLLTTGYTRESGLRELERQCAALCRKLAKLSLEADRGEKSISANEVRTLLGNPPYEATTTLREPAIGVGVGLVVASYGGDEIEIEVTTTKMAGEKPSLTLTGTLGTMMQESAQAALTCVRKHLDSIGVNWRQDIHLHVPNAAVPKDGPSAGILIALCLTSALTEQPMPQDLAATGEISLSGRVHPIGGLRDKLMAAARHQRRRVIIPKSNQGELAKIPQEVLSELEIFPVETYAEALALALPQAQTVSMR